MPLPLLQFRGAKVKLDKSVQTCRRIQLNAILGRYLLEGYSNISILNENQSKILRRPSQK
jgi:hypothetical protein